MNEKLGKLEILFQILRKLFGFMCFCFEMCLWIPFLRVNEAGKEDGIPDEEDWSIIPNQVPVSIFRVKFDSKSPWVACSVCTSTLSTNS